MRQSNKTPRKLIAIGTSAGGLEPLQIIMSNLPANLGSASIIVAQHLSPNYKSMMRELLARKTSLIVEEIKDNQRIAINKVYTVPPDNDIIIDGSTFRLVKPSSTGPKPSINKLFKSLAENFKSNAIGIILSGTGSDGTDGIKAIKKEGGVTIVQDPATAKYDGMLVSALNSQKIDHQLPPEEIGHYFKNLIGRVRNFKETVESEDNEGSQVEETVSRVLSLLEEKVGTNFNNYKASTIYRRLEKRLQDKKFSTIDKYLSYVQDNEEELINLFQYLLIGVTEFFRDPEAFAHLRVYLDKELENNRKEKRIRVWVPGCASGEEAYTIAIILCELINEKSIHDFHVQIFGTDIDATALSKARTGIYESSALERIPDNIRKNYFKRKGEKYEVVKHIRQMVLFTKHDLTSNPPFMKIDLISCRNLLIYFNQSLQNHILPVFHYSLKPHGLLFLGKSESVNTFESLFFAEDKKYKIFRAKATEKLKLKLPHLKPMVPRKPVPPIISSPAEDMSLHEMVKETLFSSYDHPFVVIDSSMDMIEVFGDVSPFLKVRKGTANINLLKLLEKDLQLELRAVATKAINNSLPISGNIRKLNIDGKDHYLRFVVKPVMYSKPVNAFYLVILEKIDLSEKLIRKKEVVDEDLESPRLIELEHELSSTKEHMNTLIEELETSNEELQALNEELQSSNEELQASNEELETSNEELQASNEELEIAYSEIRSAHEEIAQQAEEIKKSENKLKTLFNSTLQGFILIDQNYNVDTYNKTANAFFKDFFGKEIKPNDSYIDLIPDRNVEEFLRSLKKVQKGASIEHEQTIFVKPNEFKILQMVYTPVVKEDSASKQILISFIDITKLKNAEQQLKDSNEKLTKQEELWHKMADLSPDLIGILKGDNLTFEYVNQSYKKHFPNKEFEGKTIEDVFPEANHQELIKALKKVQKTCTPHTLYEVILSSKRKEINETDNQYFNITYSPLQKGAKNFDIVIYATNITYQVAARKEIEEAHKQTALEKNKLENLLSNAPACIAIHKGPNHTFDFANKKYLELIGLQNVIGKDYESLSLEYKHKKHQEILERVFNSGEPYTGHEMPVESEDNIKYYNFIYQPWTNANGKVEGVLIFAYDVTEQVINRHTIEANAAFINTLNDSMPQKVWTATPDGKYDYLNKPMLSYLGLEEVKVNDYHDVLWFKYIHPEDRKLTSELWKKALQNGDDYKIEHRLKDVDNQYKWHLTRGLPLKNRRGEIIKWIGTSTDIDEQKQVEQQKDEFLSIASHELKTPLTTIQAYSDLLKDHLKESGDKEAKIYIEKTLLNLQKLNVLISDLLDLSRIQSEKFAFDKETLMFDDIVYEAVENIKHTSKSHKITIKGKSNTKIKGDQQRLEQVLINLLSNAIKYSPDKEEVYVNVFANTDKVVCEVADQGIGIQKKHIDKIFNRYYRANEKHNFISGLGIGLFITRQIIEMHGGSVGVESKDGEGSKFYFTLPIEKK